MAADSSSAKRQSAESATIAQPRASLHVLDSPQEARSRRKFLRYFPGAFRDETYLNWERNYKWNAHLQWNELLGFTEYRALLQKGKFSEIASRALRIESRTNLLFSFEKMAIRDAVKSPAGAKAFSQACMSSYMALERRRAGSNTGTMWWRRYPESKPESSPGRY